VSAEQGIVALVDASPNFFGGFDLFRWETISQQRIMVRRHDHERNAGDESRTMPTASDQEAPKITFDGWHTNRAK
jgi:hypothetical protein